MRPDAPSAPTVRLGLPAPTGDFFARVSSRPDCIFATRFDSQADIDSLPGPKPKPGSAKQPLLYDIHENAARLSFVPTLSCDILGKMIPAKVSTGPFLFIWDFKMDEGFRWLGEGNLGRHKAWRFDPPVTWISIKVDYKEAAVQAHELAEFQVTTQSGKTLGPGTWREGETLFPRIARFYLKPFVWTRLWVHSTDLSQAICYISIWAADETREPVQLYDRLALLPPGKFDYDGTTWLPGLTVQRLEFDTSADQATNPGECFMWTRNYITLNGPTNPVLLLEKP